MSRMSAPPALTARTKAAILMVALGPKAISRVYKFMSDEDIEALTLEIARLGRIPPDMRRQVIGEFYEMCMVREVIAEGGVGQAKLALEATFGKEKAEEILAKVLQALQIMPFDFLKKADMTQLITFLRDEHPQTIALILAHLQPNQAAIVLSGLPQELRAEVAHRIAIMDKTPPEVIREVERVLERKMANAMTSQSYTDVGGVRSLVEVLNWVDRTTERTILESLTESSPDLADEVKNLMFVFEDINTLDDPSIQKVMREVESKELALALKGAGEGVQNRIFKNMSERAANNLKEEMEFMGPVRLKNVEESQQRIVGIVRRLEEAGELVISRGSGAGGDEFVV